MACSPFALGERLGVDDVTAAQAYYVCLLFYVGCTADADIAAEIFRDDASVLTHVTPVMFGSPREMTAGILRALAPPEEPAMRRVVDLARRFPRAARHYRPHQTAICEVARMLTDRLGLPASIHSLFAYLAERWDGSGNGHVKGDEIPLAVRIAHVARDAAFHCERGGVENAAEVVRARAGRAFDPAIASLVTGHAHDILAVADGASVWDEALAREPGPFLILQDEELDRAMATIGDFADLSSPYLAGHSSGVAALAVRAAERCRLDAGTLAMLRRAAFMHDLGRVIVPVRVWQKPQAHDR